MYQLHRKNITLTKGAEFISANENDHSIVYIPPIIHRFSPGAKACGKSLDNKAPSNQ